MSAAVLARVVRARGELLLDMSRERDDGPAARIMRDQAELASVLARILEGKPVLRAFGAPGDWGYDHPIGQALLEALREPTNVNSRELPPAVQAEAAAVGAAFDGKSLEQGDAQ
jgi:hypothetical protein